MGRNAISPDRALGPIPDSRVRSAVRDLTLASLDALRNHALSSGALAIKAGSSPLAKTASALYALIKGKVTAIAAGDMAALSGTVTNAYYNVFVFSADAADTKYTAMGSEATTLRGVRFPPISDGRAILGFVIIHPTGTGNFVGGTTALDDGTVVPNAAYVNTPFPFNPLIEE